MLPLQLSSLLLTGAEPGGNSGNRFLKERVIDSGHHLSGVHKSHALVRPKAWQQFNHTLPHTLRSCERWHTTRRARFEKIKKELIIRSQALLTRGNKAPDITRKPESRLERIAYDCIVSSEDDLTYDYVCAEMAGAGKIDHILPSSWWKRHVMKWPGTADSRAAGRCRRSATGFGSVGAVDRHLHHAIHLECFRSFGRPLRGARQGDESNEIMATRRISETWGI